MLVPHPDLVEGPQPMEGCVLLSYFGLIHSSDSFISDESKSFLFTIFMLPVLRIGIDNPSHLKYNEK